MKNNLFNYATKELSQDAFICWLMSYAMEESEDDEALRACAIGFIRVFIPELAQKDSSEIFVSEIKHQYKNIDVLLTVNNNYIVIIEDKTFTDEHDNQLEKYVRELREDDAYRERNIKKVYYKTGFQSDYSEVREAGYRVIERKEINDLLTPFVKKTSNRIFRDYCEHIGNIHAEAQKFLDLPISDWEWLQINGFYDHLKTSGFVKRHGFKANYGYVSNPRGGFYAMWIANQTFIPYQNTDQKYELYLQLEYVGNKMNICLKTSILGNKGLEEEINPKELRDFLVYFVNEEGEWEFRLKDYGFIKPKRYGSGKSMTLGIFCVDANCNVVIEHSIENAMENFINFTTDIQRNKRKHSKV